MLEMALSRHRIMQRLLRIPKSHYLPAVSYSNNATPKINFRLLYFEALNSFNLNPCCIHSGPRCRWLWIRSCPSPNIRWTKEYQCVFLHSLPTQLYLKKMKPQQNIYGSTSSTESIDEGLENSFNDLDVNYITIGKTKVFNDMVHPHLELPALCYKIINTPQFQRLRNLKQLGLCYHVYPSACHNRFEHCIGTSYLAGKYCKILQKKQPELEIDDKDVLCLFIAGLCHDIGHGPFSHTWESFMHDHKDDYSHEDMSIRMIDYMVEDNGLWELFRQENLDEIDLVFIKELILGHPLRGDIFEGRSPSKQFLYQIVSNAETKIDVDKFDYILRDSKQLNVTTAFDYERVIENSRVFPVTAENGNVIVADSIDPNTTTKIVYRKKISETLEELFWGRFSLHQKAYQHKVTKIIEEMVLDGLKAAEPHFQVTGKNGKVYKLSTAHEDLSAFMKLTDSIFEMILHWGNGGSKAQQIFEDIVKRNLYSCVGIISTPLQDDVLRELEKLSPNILLIKTSINYGKKSENPLSSALFYEKTRPNVLFRKEFPPSKTETKCYIVYTPDYDNVLGGGGGNSLRSAVSIGTDIKMKEAEKLVKEWAKMRKVTLEYE